MASPEKGMTTEQASLKKIAGHLNEWDYARLIKGQVNPASQAKKKDVIDSHGQTHSVKSGKKWQIFLYGRSRLESNTILRGLGGIADCLIACIDSLPQTREARELDPFSAKQALQRPMRLLSIELQNPHLLEAFFLKAAFEAGEVDYWAILPSTVNQVTAEIGDKHFHVFSAKEAVRILCDGLKVENSKARQRGQTDAQKVIFKHQHNMGEIELRTDRHNYGRMKMWLDSARVMQRLQTYFSTPLMIREQVYVYGNAQRTFKI